MALKRQLGVNYDIVWQLKHKLFQTMEEADDMYWGGDRLGWNRGRGTSGQCRNSLECQGLPILMKMNVVDGFKSKETAQFPLRHIKPGAIIISDNLDYFWAVVSVDSIISVLSQGGI